MVWMKLRSGMAASSFPRSFADVDVYRALSGTELAAPNSPPHTVS